MSDQIPSTQKGQIDALLTLLGVSDFAGAQAGITQLHSAQTEWNEQRQSLFAALGGSGDVPAHYDFAAAIPALRDNQQALFSALGVTSQADAIAALNNLKSQNNSFQANQTTIFAALGATDLAGAMRAIKDIDARIEAGVNAGVIARAASAGLTKPVDKPAGGPEGGAKTTVTRAEFQAMNSKQQLEFSQAGGKISTE